MKPTSLDRRIRSARIGVRSKQPLDYRIKLVRERHTAAKKASRRNLHLVTNQAR